MPQDPIKKTLNQISDLIDLLRSGKASNEPLPPDIEERIAKVQERAEQLTQMTQQMMESAHVTEKEVEDMVQAPSQNIDPSSKRLLKKIQRYKKNDSLHASPSQEFARYDVAEKRGWQYTISQTGREGLPL